MNQFSVKEEFLFKVCIVSLIGMFAILFFASILPRFDALESLFKVLGLLCSLCFVLTGLFFWIKHLKLAFQAEVKSLKIIFFLIVFTIPYALYLEKKYSSGPDRW